MNRRELIRMVLRGERNERVSRALFGAGRWAYQQTGLKIGDIVASPRHFAETLGDLFGELDTDIVFPGSGLNTFPAEAVGGSLAFRGGQAPLLSFPLIQKTGDSHYLSSIDIAGSPHTLALVEMIGFLRERLPDRFLCATTWGPFTWAMILCDWELLKEKVAFDRSFVREVCELGVRLSRAFIAPLAAQDVIDGIVIPDGATTLIPLELYRDVVLPAEKSLFAWAKGQGLRCFLHQCGDIQSQLALYPETGADCISVDACVPIGEVYKLYRDRVVTAGNVDVVNTVFGGDSPEIFAKVSECLSAVSDPHQGYILMPSCDLPPDTSLRNVREFLSCADRLR
ncbi:MAG: uroporphyrinogen decarboxylase family protein [Thermodesulfovibrionales bacterium]